MVVHGHWQLRLVVVVVDVAIAVVDVATAVVGFAVVTDFPLD